MAKGTCKWFSAQKGYGFLTPDDGGPDAFVHVRDLQASGIAGLAEGQRVGFEMVETRGGKQSAQKIALI